MNETEQSVPSPGKLKRLWSRVSSWWLNLPPHTEVRKAAGRGAAIIALILAAAIGASTKLGLGSVTLDLLAGAILGVLFAVIVALVGSVLLRVIEHLLEHSRRFFGWIGLGALIILFAVMDRLPLSDGHTVLLAVGLVAIHALLAGSVALFRSGLWKGKTTLARGILGTLLAAAVGVDVYLGWWLVDPGDRDHLIAFDTGYGEPSHSGRISPDYARTVGRS